MKLDQENRIYKKLLSESKVDKHIDPNTIQIASMLAILSRIVDEPNPKIDRIKKMRLYNGEKISGFSESDVRKMREDNNTEGRFGISPRFIVNTMANAMIQEDVECLTPLRLLKMLKKGIVHFSRFSTEEKKIYTDLISVVNSEYEKLAEEAVKGAIVYSLEDSANDLFETYLANVEAYVNKQNVIDEFDNPKTVDENLMRKIEKRMNVQDSGKDSFRGMILAKVGTSAVKGEKFTRHSEDPLRIAIDEIIYEENKGQIKSITTVNRPSEDLQKKISSTIERLIEEQGYCTHCANDLLKYVGAVFSREPESEE